MNPSFLYLGKVAAKVIAAASVLVLCVAVQAQSVSTSTDPVALARAALGAERGMAAVGVWRKGAATYGFAQNGTPVSAVVATPQEQPLFEIGSISKVFTGLLVAQAVEQGDLALSDTLGKLLQGKVSVTSPEVAAITLQQLLTHTSCLPRQYGTSLNGAAVVAQIREDDRVKLWEALASQTMEKAPPCVALYSNYGFAVLGELLSDRYGKPWDELVRERITGPLGMSDTVVTLGDKTARFAPPFDGALQAPVWDMKAFVGAGGLRSTPHDMLLFGRAILAGKDGPLGAAAVKLVSPLGSYEGGQIGHAIFVVGPPDKMSFSHDGLTGGYRALLTLYPDTHEVMVALVSNRQAPMGQLGTELWASRYPVRSTPVPVAEQTLDDYTGVYRVNPELAFTVVRQDDTLFVRSTRNAFNGYIPVDRDVFTRPAGGAQMTFIRNAGKVSALRLEQGGRTIMAGRTGEPAPSQATLPDGAAAGLAGTYRATRFLRNAIELNVRVERGQLAVKSSNFPRLQVYPVAGQTDRFYYEAVKAELQFERDAEGRANILVLHENGVHRLERVAD